MTSLHRYAAVLPVLIALAVQPSAGQVVRSGTVAIPKTALPTMSLPTSPCEALDDKLQISTFSDVARAGEFILGKEVRMSMWVESLCKVQGAVGSLSVPWVMSTATGVVLGQGTLAVPYGRSAEVLVSWTPPAGSSTIIGTANMGGTTIRESALTNNAKTVTIAPRLVRGHLITSQQLRNTFPFTTDVSGRTCSTQVAITGAGGVNAAHEIDVKCAGSVFGARVTVEAFNNISLQNGWKIVSSNIGWTLGGSVGWDQQPANGGTNLYSRFHTATESGSHTVGSLYITVEGPAGTSPGPGLFVIGNSVPWVER